MASNPRVVTGKVIKIGNSFYLGVPPELRDQIGEGDLVEYAAIAVAPKGQLSQTKILDQPAARVVTTRNSAVARGSKVSPPFFEHEKSPLLMLAAPELAFGFAQ